MKCPTLDDLSCCDAAYGLYCFEGCVLLSCAAMNGEPMWKNDHQFGQLTLDLSSSSLGSEVSSIDKHADRRAYFTLLVSQSAPSKASGSASGVTSQLSIARDMYSQDVTQALHAFADNLGW